MSSQCWFIHEVRVVRDSGGPVSRLEFVDGLNVVTGASDTGKSYIVDCLNYMFGGQNPPEEIPEALRYSTLVLDLGFADGRRFSLERSLHHGGDFGVQTDRTDASDAIPKILSARHGGNGKSLSELLLASCGLAGKTIRQKASKIRELRLRDVIAFAVVNETRIIEKRTPLNPSTQNTDLPSEFSTFDLLITGRDSSGVVLLPDKDSLKIGWEARTRIYDELIARAESELASAQASESADAGLQFETEIQLAETRLRASAEELDAAVEDRSRTLRLRERLQVRLTSLSQLSERFELLRAHYASDKERLKFVAEGDYLLAQLGEPHCPTCGQLLATHEPPDLAHQDPRTTTIQAATRSEIDKLDLQLRDLDASLTTLRAEQESLTGQISNAIDALTHIEASIRSNLQPAILATREIVAKLVGQRESAARLAIRTEELSELRAKRQELGDKPPVRQRTTVMPESSLERREFCDVMADTLRRWNYPANVVEFNSKSDLVIDGKARRAFGKGYRAVLHAAFTVSLLRHARNKSLPHPGFVVLDSPLTSFKEKDSYAISDDIQRGFFEDLSAERGCQFLIIENKEPPEDLVANMHYVHFSGVPGVGRPGFLV